MRLRGEGVLPADAAQAVEMSVIMSAVAVGGRRGMRSRRKSDALYISAVLLLLLLLLLLPYNSSLFSNLRSSSATTSAAAACACAALFEVIKSSSVWGQGLLLLAFTFVNSSTAGDSEN